MRRPNNLKMIEVKNVSLSFGTTTALDNLSLRVQGGAVGLLGPNGAGKSTLIKTLLGFVKPNEGTATVFGLDVQTNPLEIRKQVGYMPEDECLIPGMNAVQLVSYAGELCGMPRRDALQRAHEVLYYIGLDEETVSHRGRILRGDETACKAGAGTRT